MLFFDATDHQAYLDLLSEVAQCYRCAAHAYVLMTSHAHFFITPDQEESHSKTFQTLGRHYVTYVNTTISGPGSFGRTAIGHLGG